MTIPTSSPGGPRYEVVKINPALARVWLRLNTHNRNFREQVAKAYATDMRDGNWADDGQSIRFSRTNVLLDGQHRLWAIAESGVTLPMLVVTNLPEGAQETMDAGAKRTLADTLKLRGESNSIILAAALFRVAMWKQGRRKNFKGGHGDGRPTQRQLLAVLADHPEIRRSVEIADRSRKAKLVTTGTAALCHWIFVHIDRDDTSFFFARLGDGADLAKDDPIYALRRALGNYRDSTSRPDEALITALIIKAWNAFREGRKVGVLAYRPGGASPEAYPEPV